MSSEPPKEGTPKKYLLTAEAAQILRVSPGTMANWRYRGTGPKWRKYGGTVVYPWEEIERYSGDDGKTHVG